MKWEYQTAVEMRFGDIDMNGHANHVAYLTWAEVARARHLESMGAPADKLVQHGMAVVVLSLTVDYLHEIQFRPTVDCLTAYTFGTGKSFTGEASIVQDGKRVCSIKTVLGVLDTNKRRLRIDPKFHLESVMVAGDNGAALHTETEVTK